MRKVLASCSELGIDGGGALRAAGIDLASCADADARIPMAKLHAAWEAIAAQTGRIDAAIVAAGHYDPNDYGLLGFVVMTCATIDEAMGHFVRYIGLWTDEPGFVRDGASVRATYRHAFPDSVGKRISTESAFVQIVHGTRALTGLHTTPRAVRFTHTAPADRRSYEQYFGCPVEFAAPVNEVEFRPEDLAQPFTRSDAKLGAFLRETANRAVARREVDDASPVERARTILAEELARSLPSIRTVARRMATSPRTLRRRLAETGTSFRKLLDETRAELARAYVRDRRIPLTEVAFLLGFSEPSTFHRAFKRWTKTTPMLWRARAA